ncbi:MAG: polysaccharide biosynthesis protein [Tenericutes bacterium]|nr:polysaccharide biosynthesis protein [Mycoplasmatota bacterium]
MTPKATFFDKVGKMKTWQMILYDIFAICLTYGIAIAALSISHVSGFDRRMALYVLPVVIVIKLMVNIFSQVYRLVFQNAGFDEVFKLALAVTIGNIIIAVISIAIPNFNFIPEICLLFTNVFEVFVMVLPRIIKRFLRYLSPKKIYLSGKRTLLIGAGAGGKLVLDEIRNNLEVYNNPIAYVDDDENKIGNIMAGFPILGPIKEVPHIIDNYGIEEVIICIANITNERFQEIIQIVAKRAVTIKRLPKFKNLKKDAPSKKLQEVRVEDLLSREIVKLDNKGIKDFISGKRVLVTGAGGSIGSELVRQIIKFKPKKLLLFDIYENGVYDLQTELNHAMTKKDIDSIDFELQIGSVYNYERLDKLFKNYKPELVFHAAAYKHVPLMEDSSVEAVRTNILGTYNVCSLSDIYKVEKVVLVSSDKAVRPTNVMGATKRFAEMIIQCINSKSETNYSAVRFGNVLGSNGSVVPLFRRQIENGGPVTVTHKDITRYFMTIPEAVSLILQSGTYAKGGEIFILDMGDPVRIYDLAEKMIRLSGMKPHEDIKINVTGLRPGEKLYEELLVDKNNGHIKTDNEKIFIEKITQAENVECDVKEIVDGFEDLTNQQVKELVQKYVTSYTIKK